MSKQKDNEDLVCVGPGTVMGEMMRQYWIPAAMSSELERDGAPMRLMLLGERLIAFRDSDGNVGLVDAWCPHRRAPMFFGRNPKPTSAPARPNARSGLPVMEIGLFSECPVSYCRHR